MREAYTVKLNRDDIEIITEALESYYYEEYDSYAFGLFKDYLIKLK